MNIHDYRDKVLGCWLGKNIGGTLGAPFECKRGVFPVEFYTQDTHGEPLPNDDLDLQEVWLNAVEKYSRISIVVEWIVVSIVVAIVVDNDWDNDWDKNGERQGLGQGL